MTFFLFNSIIYFISFLCVENKGDIYQMHFFITFAFNSNGWGH